MKSEASVEIDRPIADVFEFTTTEVAQWSLLVVEDEIRVETDDKVGTTFRTVTDDRGSRMEFDGTVTLHEPPTAHGVHMAGVQFDIDAEYRFEDLGGRTRVTQISTVHPKGMMKLAFALFGWLMKKTSCDAAAKELQSLKMLMETPTHEM